MDNMSRPYTKEETRDIFLRNIHDVKESFEGKEIKPLNKSGKIEGTFLAFSVLSMIERENLVGPTFSLIPMPNGENIAGNLYSYIGYSEDMIANIKTMHLFSKTKMGLVERMRMLCQKYNQGQIPGGSDELILEILKSIDFGVDGTKLKMVANSTQAQINECMAEGKNYYPMDGIDIAGNLAARYSELFMPKKVKNASDSSLDEIIK